MLRSSFIAAFALFAMMATSAPAQNNPDADASPPNDLTCVSLVIPITGVPDDTPLSFTIPLDDMLNRCMSSSGAKITLTTPTSPITVSPTPNSNQTFAFTVHDDIGNTASGTITVTRD